MKRAVKWWPKFNLTSPEKSDFIFGATYGLVTIQAYHELDMMKMAQGKNKTIIGLLRAQVIQMNQMDPTKAFDEEI